MRLRQILAVIGLSFLLGVLPFILSLLSIRYGWTNGDIPNIWNDAGLLSIFPGLVFIIWAVRVWDNRGRHNPGDRSGGMDRVPSQLLTQGPYRYTRNPVYLGYLLIWLAWTVFYGSFVVLTAFVVLCMISQLIVVPHEERVLDEKFGDEYRSYKERVPRWFWPSR